MLYFAVVVNTRKWQTRKWHKRFSTPWRNFFSYLRRHIMVHNFYSLCNVCLYSCTCPRLLFWNYSSRFLFLAYGCVSLGWSRSRSMTLGLSNQRNDWFLAKSSLMYHGLGDLGSLILFQNIPKKPTLWHDQVKKSQTRARVTCSLNS